MGSRFGGPAMVPEGFGYEAYRQQIEQSERRAAATWTFLLSITKNDVLRPVVGDCGGLSFVIRKSDLAERRLLASCQRVYLGSSFPASSRVG